jgi:prepilin-type N-terminal cleavage/methylation domain-containing protein
MVDERGYTLVEMLIVLAILGVVMSGLTTIFVSGSNAELDLNRRFQAQQQARAALDKIRTDLHCATAAQVQTINTYPGIAVYEPSCSATVGASTVDWCLLASPSMGGRFALYRTTATSNQCSSSDTSRVKVADYLTTSTNVFSTMSVTPSGALETISIDFPVGTSPNAGRDVYELKDAIVARNSARCTSTSAGWVTTPYNGCTTTTLYAVTP